MHCAAVRVAQLRVQTIPKGFHAHRPDASARQVAAVVPLQIVSHAPDAVFQLQVEYVEHVAFVRELQPSTQLDAVLVQLPTGHVVVS